jgi:hypothetical protein
MSPMRMEIISMNTLAFKIFQIPIYCWKSKSTSSAWVVKAVKMMMKIRIKVRTIEESKLINFKVKSNQ